MVEIPDGRDIQALIQKLERFVHDQGLEPGSIVLNASGGQRLMTVGAMEWARQRGVNLLFLDRNRQVTRLRFENDAWIASQESTKPEAIAELDPNVMLELQAGKPLTSPGQWLHLTRDAAQMSAETLQSRLRPLHRADFATLLTAVDGSPLRIESKAGAPLELAAAVWILHAGVRSVRVGTTMSVPDNRKGCADEELDVHFIHDGRLWIVEAKRQRDESQQIGEIQHYLQKTGAAEKLQSSLAILRHRLEKSSMESLKLDLLSARRFGGVQAEVMRVTQAALSSTVEDFARQQKIHVIKAAEMYPSFLRILSPLTPLSGSPATVTKSSGIDLSQYQIS